MKIAILLAVGVIVFLLIACNRRQGSSDTRGEIVVGGLYASREDGVYRVSKVLAIDESAVHVRIYKNKFTSLPENLDSSNLSLGGIGDPDGFGIGHAPVAREGWLASHSFLKKEPVTEEELEGYNYYLEEMKK